MTKLGINIDHVATLRQARGTRYPDPISAAALSEKGGADQITVHLREDRRHIQDADVHLLKRSVQTDLNLEMAVTTEMIEIAKKLAPHSVTFVPEKRKELTTEGGLNVAKLEKKLRVVVPELKRAGVRVSLFIDPDLKAVEQARELAVDAIEIHTGRFAEARTPDVQAKELEQVVLAARRGHELDLYVAAGHGLHYQNTAAVAKIPEILELNIGHSIIARAVFVGIERAVNEMKKICEVS